MSGNVPEIRFKGFSDAWERRKLGERYNNIRNAFVGTATPYYVESSKNGYFYLESNNIKDGKINRNSEVFINEDFYRSQCDKWLHTGDLVMVQSGHVGHTAVIPKELDGIAAHALIMYQDPISNTDPHFVNYQFQTPETKKKLEFITTGNTIKHILASEMKLFTLEFPCAIEEQIAIGTFFRTLDDLTTLQKRKLDGLKELKKGYLQLMFPQAGETVPRVRFAGFDGGWEERKLGEISRKVAEKNKNTIFTETLTNSAEYGIINQRDFFDKDISNEKNLSGYYIVRPDDFVYNPRISNFAPVGPIKRNLLNRTGVMSPLYYVFRILVGDVTYLEKYFEGGYWHDFMFLNGDNGVRSDRFNIKDSVFSEMPIPFPSIPEQIAIGTFFRNLDTQISTQQKKLEKIKQLKAAYLQKMFI